MWEVTPVADRVTIMGTERISIDSKHNTMLTTICDQLGYSRPEAIHKALQDLYDAAIYKQPTVCDVCGLVSKTDIAHFKDGKNRCPACAAAWRQKLVEVIVP